MTIEELNEELVKLRATQVSSSSSILNRGGAVTFSKYEYIKKGKARLLVAEKQFDGKTGEPAHIRLYWDRRDHVDGN